MKIYILTPFWTRNPNFLSLFHKNQQVIFSKWRRYLQKDILGSLVLLNEDVQDPVFNKCYCEVHQIFASLFKNNGKIPVRTFRNEYSKYYVVKLNLSRYSFLIVNSHVDRPDWRRVSRSCHYSLNTHTRVRSRINFYVVSEKSLYEYSTTIFYCEKWKSREVTKHIACGLKKY